MELISSNVVTMSSKEIAELTGKEHSNVLRDIRNLVANLQNSDLKPVYKTSSYVGDNGQLYPMYELDKDTCLTLLLGYDAPARFRVVKRWQDLEAMNAPKTPVEMLVMYAHRLLDAERAQVKLEAEQRLLEQRQVKLETEQAVTKAQVQALVTGENFMTIVGYANLKKQRIDSPTASKYGKAASKYCREHGVTTGEANHPLYGACRTYPVEVLESVLPF